MFILGTNKLSLEHLQGQNGAILGVKMANIKAYNYIIICNYKQTIKKGLK